MKGILPLWKPKGMTSHDCVVKIRKLYATKKVGHTGTLDPEVEGVLPVCIGEATKIVPYLTNTQKIYHAVVQLGSATETEDAHGEVIAQKMINLPPTLEQIDKVLASFKGNITQIPPMYSAVKVDGKRLYEYARENKTVARPKRQIKISQIKRTSIYDEKTDRFSIHVKCSKGTYIRTLCVDIGKALGYPSHMYYLERTQTGSFRQEDTVTFDEIKNAKGHGAHSNFLLPIIDGLSHMPMLEVDEDIKKKVLFGQKLSRPHEVKTKEPFVIIHEGEVLAIYEIHKEKQDQIKPIRVFN